VKFPADYPEESVREKKAHYHVDIKGLERADVAELTDEYVKENLGAETVTELKERFEKRIKLRLEERAETSKRSALFKAIYEANPFEVGDLIIEEQMRTQLMRFGVINPRDPNSSQMDVTRFKPLLGEQAKNEVVEGFLANALVTHYKLEPSNEQVDAWVKDQAERYETEEEQVKKEFDFEKDPKRLTDTVARELAVEKVLAASKVVENPKA